MTIERGPTAGRQLPQRASDSRRYDTTTPEPDFSLLNYGTTSSACHRAHLERQTASNSLPDSVLDSVLDSLLTSAIESGINLARPAGDRGGW